MATLAEMFDQAVRYHQSGNLGQAESLYRQILQADHAHADAHHLLGVLAHQTGNVQDAYILIKQAITLNPAVAAYYYNLGIVHKDLGQWPEAVLCCRQALSINPNYADAHNNLGIALKNQGQLAEAALCYRQALAINPNHAQAQNNLGIVLLTGGQIGEAIGCFQNSLSSDPNFADAHNHLGVALKAQGRLAEASACFRQALCINPHYADAHNNLGEALKDQGQLAGAKDCYRQALSKSPNHSDAHNNLGNALVLEGNIAEAAECYRQALRWQPNHAHAHNNLGNLLFKEGQLAEAIQCFRRALASHPNHADAHSNLGIAQAHQGELAEAAESYRQALCIDSGHGTARANRALLRLLQEDFEGGWPEYELRWSQPGMVPRFFDQPRWEGAPLAGKTILVYAEQGLGDTIQFVRYLPMVKEHGGKVLLECQPALLGLLAGICGVDQIIEAGKPLPPFEVQAPLLSLPGIFQTILSTIPAQIPYLHANPDDVSSWGKELAALKGFKVGITWQGNPKVLDDRFRSIPLEYFEPLARLPGVSLVSLQKGEGTNQLQALAGRFPILDLSDRLETFSDTAAVMKNLDLVVSSDTSVPHLAGALGVPVWTALQFVPDWRWFMGRQDSPWYPTMRLFRQKRQGDWGEVFERVTAELHKRG